MKRTILILAALAAITLGSAAPIKLTRLEAYRLHAALEAVAPGLTPDNTFIASDDLTVLAPHAEAFRKADVARQRAEARIRAGAGDDASKLEKIIALGEAFDARAADEIPVDLQPIDISKDEQKEARIPPAVLTLLRRYLSPPKPAK